MSPRARSRFALAIWLGVISAFGALRFYMRAWDGQSFRADAVAWLWLAGSVVVAAAGAAALVHALRRRR